MKCIKSMDGEIRRVLETEADKKVKSYGWTFVPKSEWKALRVKIKEKVVVVVSDGLSIEEKKIRRNRVNKR